MEFFIFTEWLSFDTLALDVESFRQNFFLLY